MKPWFGKGKPLQLAVSACCSFAFVLFGYDQGVFSGIIGNEDFLNVVNHPDDTLMGIIVSSYNLGCFFGCVLTFMIGDYLGRKNAMWLAMVLITIGAVLQSTAYTVPHMIFARVFTGLGTGMETSTVPMYQSELCDASVRGRIVASEPLFVGVGIVIAYWFDYGMNFISPTSSIASVAWRLPIACQIIFALVVSVIIFGVPESPRYLYQKGRNEEALQVLCDIHDALPSDPKVQKESNDILEAIRLEQDSNFKWMQIFKPDSLQTGRRVLLAWGMQFMNQVGGINLVVYYVPTVLTTNVGVSREMSLILGGCINIMFPLGSLIPAFFLDQLGRRRPMMVLSFILACCMAGVAALLSFKGTSVEKSTASASIVFFFLYMFFFGAGPNCIPWVYVPEILPLHARAKGTAIAISSNWIWNFTIVMITPIILNRLQWKAYLIFVATNALFVPIIYFFYPETTRLTLEEIDLLFVDADYAQRFISPSKDEEKGSLREVDNASEKL